MRAFAVPVAIVALLVLAGSLASHMPIAAAHPREPEEPDPRAKDAEPLPDAPKLEAGNTHVALNPGKTFFLELSAAKKPLRVLLATEVCLREGALEVFLCKKGTKEHEAIVRVDADAELIHGALIATGAKPGTPTSFFNQKKQEAEFKAATGSKMNVTVVYRRAGKVHSHPAQDWIWDPKAKKPIAYQWVFAGSQLIKDMDNPDIKPFYGANSGEVISVSNFPYSMLEFPNDVSKDDDQLTYKANTDLIPPLFSKVWLILEVAPEKK